MTRLEVALGVVEGTLTSRGIYRDPRHREAFCPLHLFPAELQLKSGAARRKLIKERLPDDFPSRLSSEKENLLGNAVQHVINGYHLDTYGRRQAENIKLLYGLSEDDLPMRLGEEFVAISEMKRSRGGMEKPDRKKRWRSGAQRHWSSAMRRFLGWCLLPTNASDKKLRGPGLAREDLTLGLIVSPELIDQYLAFRRTRTADMDSKTSENFLINVAAMLYPGDGWVSGYPELLHRLPASLRLAVGAIGDWQTICARQYQYSLDLRNALDFEISRDPFGPILPMIETGRPLDLVQQALYSQRQELLALDQRTDVSPVRRAEGWRNHVLVSMLAALPLRASHWVDLTYRASDRNLYTSTGGHLRHVGGTDWGLYLRAREFKNAKNQTIFGPKGDQDVNFLLKDAENTLSIIEPLIDHYIRIHRPILCKNDGPVFPNCQGKSLKQSDLYAIVAYWSKKYLSEYGNQQYGLRLKGVSKFGPHAFRHLVATHILLTTGSYELAANMLLDSPEMVQQHYAMFLPGNRLLSSMKRIDTWKAPRWTP